jgi:hypothetical protein
LPAATQTVYVSTGGNDVTGDGSVTNPFQTIPRALLSITDASPTKRYSIMVGPGNFTASFSLKANVMIDGADPVTTRVGAVGGFIDINDPTWAGLGDNRSGFNNVSLIASTLIFDFTAQSSAEGKLFFLTTRFNNKPVFTAFNSINQVLIQNTILFAGYTQTGINLLLIDADFVNGGLITINSSTLSNTSAEAVGGGTDGDFTVSALTASVNVFLFGFTIVGTLTVDGACTVTATVNSIPINHSFTGGSTLVFINDATALAYTPINLVNWHVPFPTTVQEALDQLASRVP